MRKMSPVLVALFLIGAARANAAGPIRKLSIGNWSGGSYTNDDTGAFSHCAAAVRYRNGIFLVVSVNRAFQWAIGLMRPSWNLIKGDVLPFRLTFDGRGAIDVNGRVKSPTFVVIDMPLTKPAIRNFEYANRMTAHANGYAFQFDLRSTADLLPALVRCVKAELNVPQPGPEPAPAGSGLAPQPGPAPPARPAPAPPSMGRPPPAFAPSTNTTASSAPASPVPLPNPPPAPPPGQASRASASSLPVGDDLHDQAVKLARNFILASHLTAPRVLSRADTPAAFVAFGAAWKSDQGYGTVRIIPADGKTKGVDVTAMVIAADAKACKGQFLSARASEMIDSEVVFRGLSSCKDSQGTRTAEYFVVPRKQAGFAVFSVVSAADLNAANDLTGTKRKMTLEKAALKATE